MWGVLGSLLPSPALTSRFSSFEAAQLVAAARLGAPFERRSITSPSAVSRSVGPSTTIARLSTNTTSAPRSRARSHATSTAAAFSSVRRTSYPWRCLHVLRETGPIGQPGAPPHDRASVGRFEVSDLPLGHRRRRRRGEEHSLALHIGQRNRDEVGHDQPRIIEVTADVGAKCGEILGPSKWAGSHGNNHQVRQQEPERARGTRARYSRRSDGRHHEDPGVPRHRRDGGAAPLQDQEPGAALDARARPPPGRSSRTAPRPGRPRPVGRRSW